MIHELLAAAGRSTRTQINSGDHTRKLLFLNIGHASQEEGVSATSSSSANVIRYALQLGAKRYHVASAMFIHPSPIDPTMLLWATTTFRIQNKKENKGLRLIRDTVCFIAKIALLKVTSISSFDKPSFLAEVGLI